MTSFLNITQSCINQYLGMVSTNPRGRSNNILATFSFTRFQILLFQFYTRIVHFNTTLCYIKETCHFILYFIISSIFSFVTFIFKKILFFNLQIQNQHARFSMIRYIYSAYLIRKSSNFNATQRLYYRCHSGMTYIFRLSLQCSFKLA